MSTRTRFVSAWRSAATIIFFAGIFLEYRPLGYSAITIAILMWIIGGAVANLIFGPKKAEPRKSTYKGRVDKSFKEEIQLQGTISCPSCKVENQNGSTFCIECGMSLERSQSNSTTKSIKSN